MTSKSLKVYGWSSFRSECTTPSRQTREIIAAASKAAACDIAGIKDGGSRRDVSETGNTTEIEIANTSPGVVFWRPLDSDPRSRWFQDGESTTLCGTCLGQHAKGGEHRAPASAKMLLERLLDTESVTNRNVLLLLRAGTHPSDGHFYANRGTAAVGDEYAEHGRLRSQAIQRTLRRAQLLGLCQPGSRTFVPTRFCEDVLAEISARKLT